MIGIFTAAQNEQRLARIEKRVAILKRKRRTPAEQDEFEDLSHLRDELNQYFMDLWRIEGGGASGFGD
jgi:protein-arginine kinase activator protein McsA